MLAELVGKFSGDSTYSELLSLSPELASDVTSLSGLVGSLGVAVGQSVGNARFEFFAAPNGRWCGSVGSGGLGEHVVRKGGAGAGW